MKKAIITSCAILMLVACIFSGFSAAPTPPGDSNPTPYFDHLAYFYNELLINGYGNATSTTFGYISGNKYVSGVMELQQHKNGSWQAIASWDIKSRPSGLLEVSGNQYVSSGYYYALTSSVSVYDSATNAKLEQVSASSQVVYY